MNQKELKQKFAEIAFQEKWGYIKMIKLWPHQQKAFEKITDSIQRGKNPLCIMATGSGKTPIEALIINYMKEQNKKGLAFAHRSFLLDQLYKRITEWTNLIPNIEQAKSKANWTNDIILATPQTLKGKRLHNKPKNRDYILIDEAHRAVTNLMLKIYNHFNNPIRIGMTATADRPDGIKMYPIFDEVAFEYSMLEGIKDGFLSKLKGRRISHEIDLSSLVVKHGDYINSDIANVLEEELPQIVNTIIEETKDRKKVLIFMPNIMSSRHISMILNEKGEKAGFVSGKNEDNKLTMAKFGSGLIKYMAACQLVVEGYDEPGIDCIVMLRPTLSRIFFSQAIGRGTRIHHEKEDCLLLEFTFNSNKHKLVTAFEIMTGEISPHIVDRVIKKNKEEYEIDYYDQIIEAIVNKNNPKSILKNNLTYDFTNFDIFTINDILGIDNQTENEVWFDGRKLEGEITQKQKTILEKYQISSEGLDKAKASNLIGKIFKTCKWQDYKSMSEQQKKIFKEIYPGQNIPENIKAPLAELLIQGGKSARNSDRMCWENLPT